MEQEQEKKISSLPLRPQRTNNLNQIAQPIALVSNHFRIDVKAAQGKKFVYSVEIQPEIARDARKLRYDILEAAKQAIQEEGLEAVEFSGMNLWTTTKKDQPVIVKSIVADTQYSIKLVYKKTVQLQEFGDSLDIDKSVRNPQIQNINIMIKNSMRQLGMAEIGRNSKYYNPRTRYDNEIPNAGLTVWRGFKTSLHIASDVPYLLIDFSSRVLREDTVLDAIYDMMDKNKSDRDIVNSLIGLPIIAAYGNYRIYRIDDLDFSLNPEKTFDNKGKQTQYLEYYEKQYKIKIKDKKQPLILYRDKRNPEKVCYLIPELMNFTGMTDAQRRNFKLMQEVAKFTKLDANQRNNEIMTALKSISSKFNSPSMEIINDQKVMGIKLNPPRINLGKNKDLSNDTGFFIIKDPVYMGAHIKDWFMIYSGRSKNDDKDADFLVNELKKNGSKIGIRVEDPYYIVVKDNNPNTWVRELEQEIKKGGKPQIILSFVNDRDKDRIYGPIKDFCIKTHGISSQNVLTKFCNSKNPSASASKIVQQMNVKLGSPIWEVPRPKGMPDRTMLVGIDIYHKLIKKSQSCMGIVCSLDQNFTKYYSRVLIMKKDQKMASNISNIIKDGIIAYYEHNKKQLPENIIVYRVGVGDSQIEVLQQIETEGILNGIKDINENYNPAFAEILVNKKINHRFFQVDDGGSRPQSSRGAKGGPRPSLINPPTGTIVADKVTSKYFDFFLCAQYVTQGVCTPTHYVVIQNTTKIPEEIFWQLTYYQCFNYLNWSGAVRVPACVQYAHKLAFLVGETFQDQVHDNLQKQLCYL